LAQVIAESPTVKDTRIGQTRSEPFRGRISYHNCVNHVTA
jgi:hypothetical protein